MDDWRSIAKTRSQRIEVLRPNSGRIMVVASGTADSHPQKYGTERVRPDPWRNPCTHIPIMPASLVVSSTAGKPVAMRASEGALGQNIAGNLLRGEPVERIFRLKRRNHPIAIGPDLAIVSKECRWCRLAHASRQLLSACSPKCGEDRYGPPAFVSAGAVSFRNATSSGLGGRR